MAPAANLSLPAAIGSCFAPCYINTSNISRLLTTRSLLARSSNAPAQPTSRQVWTLELQIDMIRDFQFHPITSNPKYPLSRPITKTSHCLPCTTSETCNSLASTQIQFDSNAIQYNSRRRTKKLTKDGRAKALNRRHLLDRRWNDRQLAPGLVRCAPD